MGKMQIIKAVNYSLCCFIHILALSCLLITAKDLCRVAIIKTTAFAALLCIIFIFTSVQIERGCCALHTTIYFCLFVYHTAAETDLFFFGRGVLRSKCEYENACNQKELHNLRGSNLI